MTTRVNENIKNTNTIPLIQFDDISISKYRLTQEEGIFINGILLDYFQNKTELVGWNRPEVIMIDDTKGYVKGNVEYVCGILYDLVENVRSFRDNKKRSNCTGRNEPCPCDSGKKYKKCCLK